MVCLSCCPVPLLRQVHEAIRANPLQEKKARNKPAAAKRWQPAKSTYEERKERLKVRAGWVLLKRGPRRRKVGVGLWRGRRTAAWRPTCDRQP
jgi:hypothetical protein